MQRTGGVFKKNLAFIDRAYEPIVAAFSNPCNQLAAHRVEQTGERDRWMQEEAGGWKKVGGIRGYSRVPEKLLKIK